MSQFALPLRVAAAGPAGIVVTPALEPVAEALRAAMAWPYRTALLSGPPRSGKSLFARWFAEQGLGAAIDDAAAEPEEALFHRWNRAQAAGAPLLLVAPEPWPIALPDLASRLRPALRIVIPAPDDALVAALIAIHAAGRGLIMDKGAAAWLAARIERSHAAIERVVDEIDRLSLERKASATISLVRDALDPAGQPRQPRLL